MSAFAQVNPITDICFLVEDIDRAVAFYVNSLGFKPRRRAPGFADFKVRALPRPFGRSTILLKIPAYPA